MAQQQHVFATPQEAEVAFYRAFEQADIEAMMSVWNPEQSSICIHPGGTRLQGVAEIRESWERIFSSERRLHFELTEQQYTQDSLLSIHQVKENIQVQGVLQGVVLATNVYLLVEGGWRMMVHHASPDPGSAETSRGETLH